MNAASPSRPSPSLWTARLDKLLQGLAAKANLPHAVLAVESMDQSFQWAAATGPATPDGDPMQVATPFFIASIDKLFTAVMALKLHEAKRLDLDAPFSSFLPRELTRGLHRLSQVDHTDDITLRHLLSHTSGLADYLEDYPKGGKSLIERLFESEDPEITLDMGLRIVREDLSPHFPPQPVDAPKRKARYCDTNFLLLNAILEQVSGQPLHALCAEMIFAPLGLKHTWFLGDSEPAEPTLPPATLWVGPDPLDRPQVLRSMKSIYSTAQDLITFLRALVRGELFEDPATGRMQQVWNRFGFPRDRASLRAPGWPIAYGLGMMHFQLPRLFAPFAPMPAIVGHSGSTGTFLFYCPDLEIFVAGSVDQATAGAVPYRLLPKVLRVTQHPAG